MCQFDKGPVYNRRRDIGAAFCHRSRQQVHRSAQHGRVTAWACECDPPLLQREHLPTEHRVTQWPRATFRKEKQSSSGLVLKPFECIGGLRFIHSSGGWRPRKFSRLARGTFRVSESEALEVTHLSLELAGWSCCPGLVTR